jgi:hypothetical protein
MTGGFGPANLDFNLRDESQSETEPFGPPSMLAGGGAM